MLRLSVEAQHQGRIVGGPKEYEQIFIDRCNSFLSLPGFPEFERLAQQCIDLHCADNADGISARVYIDFMIGMPRDCFEKWLKRNLAKRLWHEFGGVPVDESGELIADEWVIPSGLDGYSTLFTAGTHREEIWYWFEETFDVSVATDLMYSEGKGFAR